LDNINKKGFEKPTAIQDKTIPLVLAGKDVVGIANTGTGKTAAFGIPMLHDLITHMDHRAIIIAPTRELAQQIMEECFSFGKGCGLRSALLIGGASMNMQRRDLRYNPRVVVGTPGRIKDHIQQGTLPLSLFNFVVLDEVDRMLDMGFINDITSILARVSKDRQSLFFSATMDSKISSLIDQFSKDPVRISTKEGSTVDSVSQNVVYYGGSLDKMDKLHDVLIAGGFGKAIIFDDTKRAVDRLGRELTARGFKVDEIHGDKSQAQRSRALDRLKKDEINILVATDVAARGIDVSDITHVINYSTPNSYDDYVHRIGRTGRAGKTGIALTFLPR
jgi:superfamily II DNA/RNA helicase